MSTNLSYLASAGPAGGPVTFDTAESIYLLPKEGITKTTMPPSGIWFPIAPEEYTIARVSDWNVQKVVGLGSVSHPAGTQPVSVSFSGFFPGYYDPSVCLGIPGPSPYFLGPGSVYCETLDALAEAEDVFTLTILGAPFEALVHIENFTWKGSYQIGPFARSYDISFAEWQPQDLTVRRGARYFKLPKTYRPRAGEDLRDVAMRFYGRESDWKRIAKANGIKQTPNAKIPASKKVLKLPGGDSNPQSIKDRWSSLNGLLG